jgi:palmitoyltransferase
MIERLKSAEGSKLAVLQHDIAELQRDIDKINDLVHTINDLTHIESDPIDFLLRIRNLTDSLEFLIAHPFKQEISVVPYDLPREMVLIRHNE